MSIYSGPEIDTSGLVFYYDMNNTQKSFLGAPTVNLQVPNMISWGGDAPVTVATQISPTGLPAYNVTDNSTTSYLRRGNNITVANNSATYTISIYILKTTGGTSARLGFNSGFTGGTQAAFNQRFNSDTGVGNTGTVQDLGEWWRWQFQITNNSTGNTILYCDFYPATGLHNSGDNPVATGTAVVSSVQIEQQPFATPFVNGTRSDTQALVDLTGQNTITASSLTYASDNTFSFNGSNNLAIFPENSAFNTQTPTIEVWVRTNATTQNGFWFEKGIVNSQYALFQEGTVIQWRMNISGVGITNLSTTTATFMNTTNWFQVVATYTSGSRILYINGVQVNSDAQTGTISTNANGCSIGVYGGFSGARGYYYNGSLAVVKVYNRVLSASEVNQNFQALRSRFGV